MSFDPLMPRVSIPIRERGMYVPDWYTPHGPAELNAVVTRDDGSLPNPSFAFRVKDVLPERRWAISAMREDGSARMLTQDRFERMYKIWISKGLNSRGEMTDVPGDPDKESIPNVERFVMASRDAYNRPTTLGFVPSNKKPDVPRVMYDANGENPISTLDAVAASDADSAFESAPCGKKIKKGFVRQHTRWCKACGGGEEGEAA